MRRFYLVQVKSSLLILEAQSWSEEKKTRKAAESVLIVKQVYSEIPNYDKIVPVLLEHGVENLSKYCKLTPGNNNDFII